MLWKVNSLTSKQYYPCAYHGIIFYTGGCDLHGHPLVILPSQRYPNLVQLNQADVIRLLKYLAFLSRFGIIFLIIKCTEQFFSLFFFKLLLSPCDIFFSLIGLWHLIKKLLYCCKHLLSKLLGCKSSTCVIFQHFITAGDV